MMPAVTDRGPNPFSPPEPIARFSTPATIRSGVTFRYLCSPTIAKPLAS